MAVQPALNLGAGLLLFGMLSDAPVRRSVDDEEGERSAPHHEASSFLCFWVKPQRALSTPVLLLQWDARVVTSKQRDDDDDKEKKTENVSLLLFCLLRETPTPLSLSLSLSLSLCISLSLSLSPTPSVTTRHQSQVLSLSVQFSLRLHFAPSHWLRDAWRHSTLLDDDSGAVTHLTVPIHLQTRLDLTKAVIIIYMYWELWMYSYCGPVTFHSAVWPVTS